MGFWSWIAEVTGITDLEDGLIGWAEIIAGGVVTAYGAIYSAESLAGGNTLLSTVPLAVTTAGAIAVLDGLDRSGLWEWKNIISWNDVMYGYVLGGLEGVAGLYCVYEGATSLATTTGKFTYQGVGYGIGAAFLGAGAFLLYDAYGRLDGLMQYGHLLVTNEVSYRANNESNYKIRFYKFNYKIGEDLTGLLSGDLAKKKCENTKGAMWVDDATLNNNTDKCVNAEDYNGYKNYWTNADKAEHEAYMAAKKIGEDGDRSSTLKFNQVFDKRFRDLTCREWTLINAIPDTNEVWTESARKDWYSSRMNYGIPDECKDAIAKGKNIDFVPKTDLLNRQFDDKPSDNADRVNWDSVMRRVLGYEGPEGVEIEQDNYVPQKETRDMDTGRLRIRDKNKFREDMSKYSSGKDRIKKNMSVKSK